MVLRRWHGRAEAPIPSPQLRPSTKPHEPQLATIRLRCPRCAQGSIDTGSGGCRRCLALNDIQGAARAIHRRAKLHGAVSVSGLRPETVCERRKAGEETVNRIAPPREKHPSGKPLRRDERRSYGDGYANRDEPKTARLRQKHNTEVIGFVTDFLTDDDDA